ncbi:MAG: hypothetical protein PHQ11_08835 [Paludibacter sp.]|nr:hypothetical protein [Paludibacter sp.]
MMSKSWFWNYQLGKKVTGEFYRSYKYPHILLKKLVAIKDYCLKNSINLMIISPPTHVDLQNKIHDYRLEREYKKYKEELNTFPIFMDYDKQNSITENRKNFDDPYHFNERVARNIVNEISKKITQ